MKNKLKIDNAFIPCPVADGDELFPNGIFEFNITKMIEHIQNNPDFVIEDVDVDNILTGFSSINESHVNSVNISNPVILAEISPGRYNVIDGNHRMEKARRMGVKILRAYKINADQHIKFLTSKEAYVTYIEYWNGKLKEIQKSVRKSSKSSLKKTKNSY